MWTCSEACGGNSQHPLASSFRGCQEQCAPAGHTHKNTHSQSFFITHTQTLFLDHTIFTEDITRYLVFTAIFRLNALSDNAEEQWEAPWCSYSVLIILSGVIHPVMLSKLWLLPAALYKSEPGINTSVIYIQKRSGILIVPIEPHIDFRVYKYKWFLC